MRFETQILVNLYVHDHTPNTHNLKRVRPPGQDRLIGQHAGESRSGNMDNTANARVTYIYIHTHAPYYYFCSLGPEGDCEAHRPGCATAGLKSAGSDSGCDAMR